VSSSARRAPRSTNAYRRTSHGDSWPEPCRVGVAALARVGVAALVARWRSRCRSGSKRTLEGSLPARDLQGGDRIRSREADYSRSVTLLSSERRAGHAFGVRRRVAAHPQTPSIGSGQLIHHPTRRLGTCGGAGNHRTGSAVSCRAANVFRRRIWVGGCSRFHRATPTRLLARRLRQVCATRGRVGIISATAREQERECCRDERKAI
jgi:hypothetical protein